MDTLPLQLKLGKVLLVGSGDMAQAKYRLLNEMGAKITWLESCPNQQQLDQLTHEQINHASRFALVVIAGTAPWCAQLADWARSQHLLMNQVDNPQGSDVFIPAIVKRGALRIGIGSGGINPVLSRLIRENIETHLPEGITKLINLTARWHTSVRKRLPDYRKRRLFWESILGGSQGSQLLDHNDQQQDALVEKLLVNVEHNQQPLGMVWMVGAGPGDTSLMTIAGLRALKTADVVLHDLLISPQILNLARRDARIEAVGRRTGYCAKPLDVLCQRMIELAKEGKIVCRLKGGDPSLFGRSGEELAALAQANIPWKVVPGITTASAAAASLGLPLTHRAMAHAVRFITGHHQIEHLVRNQSETLAVYMGYRNLKAITQRLQQNGESSSLPILLIQNVSCANQKHHLTTLAKLADYSEVFHLANGPVLIIIGETASITFNTSQSLAQPHLAIA